MRKTFTLVMLSISFIPTFAQVSSFGNCPSDAYSNSSPKFSGTPQLVTGTHLNAGAVYKYTSTVTFPFNIYALVKIDTIANARLVELDAADNISESNDGRFQPHIRPDQATLSNNRSGYVQFTFAFYNTSTQLPADIAGLNFSLWDMDGLTTGSNGWFREMGCLTGQTNLSFSSIPASEVNQLAPVSDGVCVWDRFLGTTAERTDVLEHPETAVVARYGPTTAVTFRLGYDFKYGGIDYTAPDARQYVARFGCFNFIEAAPLPVLISYFNATANGNLSRLNWVTQSELNHNHFEIERSFDNNDFKTIAILLGTEAADKTTNNYQYIDKSPELKQQSIVYYRLKQVDKDLKFTYSSIKAVRFSGSQSSLVQVSPNPFKSALTVKYKGNIPGEAEIKILNLAGQQMVTCKEIVYAGNNNLNITGLDRLTRGIYIIQVLVDGVVAEHRKLVKD